MFPYTHPYTNCAAACTYVYGRYSHTSSRRERTPSRINGIRNDLQKDVDCSGKALSTESDWTCSYWVMPHENYILIVVMCIKLLLNCIGKEIILRGWKKAGISGPIKRNYCFASGRPFQSNI